MRALLQRVTVASVAVDGEPVGAIGPGWLVFLGVGRDDDAEAATGLAEKAALLRCFPDDTGRANLSAGDVGAEWLVVSQFTLYTDTARGRRPSFGDAAAPELARALVDRFVSTLRARGFRVEEGSFGAHMQVSLVNDGPFTIWLDTAIH